MTAKLFKTGTGKKLKSVKCCLKVIRKRSAEFDLLPGYGMRQLQFPGVQHLALDFGKCGEHPAVGRIPEHRYSDRGQVDPDLMGAAGQDADFHETDRAAVDAAAFFQPVTGEGELAVAFDDRHFLAVDRMPADESADFRLGPVRNAADDGKVGFRRFPARESRAELVLDVNLENTQLINNGLQYIVLKRVMV